MGWWILLVIGTGCSRTWESSTKLVQCLEYGIGKSWQCNFILFLPVLGGVCFCLLLEKTVLLSKRGWLYRWSRFGETEAGGKSRIEPIRRLPAIAICDSTGDDARWCQNDVVVWKRNSKKSNTLWQNKAQGAERWKELPEGSRKNIYRQEYWAVWCSWVPIVSYWVSTMIFPQEKWNGKPCISGYLNIIWTIFDDNTTGCVPDTEVKAFVRRINANLHCGIRVSLM